MQDCYKILGVKPNATASEIKRAYRQKAKEYHPDLASNLSEEEIKKREESFLALRKAYEVLSDVRQRSMFDVSYHAYQSMYTARKNVSNFDYRQWLIERGGEEDLSKLIFWDLMHGREDEAVEYFKKLNSSKIGFKLSCYFTREDFMDYGFILSEELIIRLEYYDAALLLEQIIRMEYSYSYFKLFFPEVIDLAQDVFKKHICGTISDELAIDVYERALELNLGAKNDAFYLARTAECYKRIGDVEISKICAAKARELDPKVYISV